jgi:hypothetical protein
MSSAQRAAHAAELVVGPDAPAASDGRVSFAERLEIAGELLAALDEATDAGQPYLMRRIVDIIRDEILWPGFRLGPQLVTVMETVADLDHQVARLAPDPDEFRRQASGVLELLSFVVRSRRLDGSTTITAASERERDQRRS